MNDRRLKERRRPVAERVRDYRAVTLPPRGPALEKEGLRCQDCGTSFCHIMGCPLGNLIPEWNEAVGRGRWHEAWWRLELTNNFPEITGRICPALCEASCTRSIHSSPVAIRPLELAIIERAFAEGWVVPRPPARETGRRVAVIGSGPAGLAAAQQLRRQGHRVSLFERRARLGGLLRYGIPDFKLEKWVLDRRLEQLRAEGVEFEPEVTIGEDLSVRYLRRRFEAIVLAPGAGVPRDLSVPGRGYEGVHHALEFLIPSNRRVAGEIPAAEGLRATGKRVVVIGGGDTGADCVGTAVRQGARSVTQVEILPQPREWREPSNPDWPAWPAILRTSTSHEEGCRRLWGASAVQISGDDNPTIQRVHFVQVEWKAPPAGGPPQPVPVPGSDFTLEADLLLLAMGFTHVEHGRLLEELGVALDGRGHIAVDGSYATSSAGVFAAGDAHTGASLVVRAIDHGRRAAAAVGEYLG